MEGGRGEREKKRGGGGGERCYLANAKGENLGPG